MFQTFHASDHEKIEYLKQGIALTKKEQISTIRYLSMNPYLIFWLNQTIGISFAFIYHIHFIGFCIAEYKEVVS